MNKQQEPRLRFQGFTGEWEEKVLGENASFTKGSGYSKSDLTDSGFPIILYGRLYTQYENIIENVDTFVSCDENALKSLGNEVIVPASGETAEDIARASAVYQQDIILGGDLNIITPNENIASPFLALTLTNGKSNQELAKKAQGKSVVHLRNDDLRACKVSFPSLPEQTHLGLFFRRLDNQIAESRAVLEKSRQLKKAMLAKMFPANGEKIPKIRFKGFVGEWECRKLGELCTITTGKLDANAMTENGKYDFFTSGIKKYKIDHYAFIGPAITIAGNGATVGYMHYADGYFNAYQRTYVLTGIQANRNFIFSEINQKLRNKIKQESRAGNIPYIVLDMLTELSIDIPTIEEQTAIGNFFRQLDETIALQSAEIEKLNQLKKGLLAAMLV